MFEKKPFLKSALFNLKTLKYWKCWELCNCLGAKLGLKVFLCVKELIFVNSAAIYRAKKVINGGSNANACDSLWTGHYLGEKIRHGSLHDSHHYVTVYNVTIYLYLQHPSTWDERVIFMKKNGRLHDWWCPWRILIPCASELEFLHYTIQEMDVTGQN